MVNDQPRALPADQRPFDDTPVHTAELPETPIRDRNIPAEAWVEAPRGLLSAGGEGPGPWPWPMGYGPWPLPMVRRPWHIGIADGGDAVDEGSVPPDDEESDPHEIEEESDEELVLQENDSDVDDLVLEEHDGSESVRATRSSC